MLKIRSLRTESLPFDWMLCHMDFVYDVTVSLYEDPFEKSFDLFFDSTNQDTWCHFDVGFEHYKTVPVPSDNAGIYNRRYKISFPHDPDRSVKVTEKYKRRLGRLKDVLLDKNNFIRFLYISPASSSTQYSINGENLTENAGNKLNKFNSYLKTKRNNFDIIFVDTLNDRERLSENIYKVNVMPDRCWVDIVNQLNVNTEFNKLI